jgi:hypothetical protein
MTKESVTFLIDTTIQSSIQELADRDFDGNFSQALRSILKKWNQDNS